MKAVTNKKTEEGTVENAKEAVKKPNIALVGVKKGAIAAKEAATKIAAAPSKVFDSAVYSACYGMSYGVVFTSLAIGKMLPVNSHAMKGFRDGVKVARKDFNAHQEKHPAHEKSTTTH
ncbi:MAG TPA: hypothetical protein VIF37_04220 [Methylobacter sp.]|jgi:hypothetical protein